MADLFCSIPFRTDKNLGAAYNEHIALLPEHAWAVFLDHDAMWTTPHWHAQISEAIRFKPNAGAFTAMTNRIASPWQQTGARDSNDIAWHRGFGHKRREVRTLLDITDTKGFGGVVFVISKSAWRQIGGFVDGMGCVDHCAHFALADAGFRNYLIEGLYVFHLRASSGAPNPDVPKAKDCRCRGREVPPTVRVTLP